MTDSNTAERRFDIIKLYIRDLSFEVPNAPAAYQEKTPPKVDIEIDSAHQAVGDNVHEVALTVRVSAKIEDRTLFMVEVVQAGLFGIAGFGDQERDVMLGSFCPGTLFPYVREVVSDATAKGGFQPLLLAPINFDSFYQARKQRQAAQAKTAAESVSGAAAD